MYLKDKDSVIIIRVSSEKVEQLHNLADSVNMPFSDYMRFVISHHLHEYLKGVIDNDKTTN